jgi:hypothetical protein
MDEQDGDPIACLLEVQVVARRSRRTGHGLVDVHGSSSGEASTLDSVFMRVNRRRAGA